MSSSTLSGFGCPTYAQIGPPGCTGEQGRQAIDGRADPRRGNGPTVPPRQLAGVGQTASAARSASAACSRSNSTGMWTPTIAGR